MQTQRTRITARRAEALLFPIAAFLRAGGMSKQSAARRFSIAFDKTKKPIGARRIEHIGNPMLYADVVALWSHDPRFLDTAGRPRALALDGKNELSTLIRAISPRCDPKGVIGVLIRFGNVRRTKAGKYRLIRPLFFTSTTKTMAFEPMAYFLSDASATLGRILRRTHRTRGPELFWRKVECAGLSAPNALRFVAFVRERGQEFLEEVDDWLEARSDKGKTKRSSQKLRRVGLGLFSIDSKSDLARPEL